LYLSQNHPGGLKNYIPASNYSHPKSPCFKSDPQSSQIPGLSFFGDRDDDDALVLEE
jgi:hypothetical protein